MGEVDKAVEIAFEFKPNIDAEFYELLSVRRFDERQCQNFMQMLIQTNLLEKGSQRAVLVPLPPKSLVSVEEGHAGVMLAQALSMRIDLARVGAMSIQELLRGYSILKELAKEGVANSGTLFPRYSRKKLLSEFNRCGLPRISASNFLASATFKRSSRDTYDQPLLRCDNGDYILFGFSMLHADLTKTILSSIANLKVSISEKGFTFEDYVRTTLLRNGFEARNIKVKRGPSKAEYDFDLVFTWEDYVFFLECKNRGLPWSSSVATYYFNLEVQSHIGQVKRLMRGLEEFPNILTAEFPEAVGKKQVFCVVNALPFVMKGPVDGVYFTDSSMLGRFFESPTFGITTTPLKKDTGLPTDREEIARIWETEQPTADDFLRYLANPPQLSIAAASFELQVKAEWLSDKVVAKVIDFHKKQPSTEYLRKLFSEPDAMRSEVAPGGAAN